MSDMSVSAGLASGAMASALQQQTLGAQLISKTLQGQDVVAAAPKVVDAGLQHKGNALDTRV